jgi:hypothetical protein
MRLFSIAMVVFAIFVLTGCAAIGPVKSEISTYDSTFTAGVSTYGPRAKERINPFFALGRSRTRFHVSSDGYEDKPYFIEFRARNALTYGHASVVFGKLRDGKIPVDAAGVLDPELVQISGLHPATSDPKQWAKGHIAPVPAETGPSDGDFEDLYVTARYQINLTEDEFRKVVRIINRHKQSYAYWYAPNYATNCLGYIGSIAKDMGLKVPVVPTMPKQYVRRLEILNSYTAGMVGLSGRKILQ